MMMNREMLTPVSFHLRNFNNYIQLDIPVSKRGNFTLIGENAAGKTTLANCFFPMLVDGSIATPSFNPAKGTDKIERTSTRNSKNDTRTFESMLLGWGKGAMKVRTGYSYVLLKSKSRQVIIGIGAHRAVGENRKPTWWFVATSNNVNEKLVLMTTDKNNLALEKDAFIKINAALGNSFRVFSQLGEFQSYIAENIYGFTDIRSLHQLANTYRLLASPILTAGNARLTPILEAMKNAQEGIDNQIISSVAATQRGVNRKRALLERISRGQDRLKRLKKEIFWRNFNRLNERYLDPYSKLLQQINELNGKKEKAQKDLSVYSGQLKLLKYQLEKAFETVSKLQEQKAKQKSITEQRKNKLAVVKLLKQQLKNYSETIDSLRKQEVELNKSQKRIQVFESEKNLLNQNLTSIKNKTIEQTKGLQQLDTNLTIINLKNQLEKMKHYLHKMKSLQKDYQNIVDSQIHLNEDIKIVTNMRENMDVKIDLRTNGPVVGRIRNGLHQDNLEVHNAGAAQMNTRYAALEQKKLDLLSNNPDLKEFLRDSNLYKKLDDVSKYLTQLNKELEKKDSQLKDENSDLIHIQEDISKIKQALEDEFKDFDLEAKKAKVLKINQEIAILVVDPLLNDKFNKAQSNLRKYQHSETDLNQKITTETTNISNFENQNKELTRSLNETKEQAESYITSLKPYAIEDVEINNIDDAMIFLNQHRNGVKNYRYEELSTKISKLIRTNNRDGIDPYALDTLFEDRGYNDISSLMRQNRSVYENDLITVSFDINQVQKILDNDHSAVEKSLKQLKSGNEVAQITYLQAAIHQISDQYELIDGYNEMLAQGVKQTHGIQLKVSLKPKDVDEQVIKEARDTSLSKRPTLLREVQNRLERLANDTDVADDDELFMEKAYQLLDIRHWSDFQIWIHRKQAEIGEFELVDDKFVQSGGSGAEKAQAMVLPLLLVPKMILHRSKKSDAPHLVMFDEFADKLDPETAKSFARTIDQFGFNFLATMPSGSQNKILADGVDNIAYDVIAPAKKNDSKFHKNIVRPALIWTR